MLDLAKVVALGATHDGPLVLCESGLHASREPWDALQYAPGPWLARVTLAGEIVPGDDKLVARRRRIDARRDATALLRQFAREEALRVIHLWDAPEIVRTYLETGREDFRAAARDAARDVQRAEFQRLVDEVLPREYPGAQP
jgi:hypothetical protein